MRLLLLITILLSSLSTLLGQSLSVQDKLVLCAPLNKESPSRKLYIKNTGSRDAKVDKIVIKGNQATDFNLVSEVSFPLVISEGDSTALNFIFKPKSNAGIHQSRLEILSGDLENDLANIQLIGLATQGLGTEKEPSLLSILNTIGYKINIGDSTNHLSTKNILLGEEIQLNRFVKATGETVIITPIARFSANEQVSFGYYFEENDQLIYGKVGTLSDKYLQHQTLYPSIATGKTSFAPDDNSFGIFISTSTHATYTDFNLNAEDDRVCRIYPVKNAKGALIENQYLICFDETKNGDFQDFVFIIKNVSPYIAP